jgi:hypothetical protein
MMLDATPWARNALTPEDRAEIAQTEPYHGRAMVSRDGRGGMFRVAITHATPGTVQQGYGASPIAAFRVALAKVPA